MYHSRPGLIEICARVLMSSVTRRLKGDGRVRLSQRNGLDDTPFAASTLSDTIYLLTSFRKPNPSQNRQLVYFY